MPTHTETQILPFSAQQMFDLVLDVEKYPEFLPWCVALRVKRRGEQEMFADMAVGFKMLREKYSSHITWNELPESEGGGYHMHIKDAGGPFKFLETDWKFHPKGNDVEVDFRIDFEFSSIILEKTMGAIFTEAAHKMMQAFVKRAEAVYSKSVIASGV